MTRIVFATACNGRYLERMRPYLESIQTHSRLPVHLVCVGFLPPPGHWVHGLDKVLPATLPHAANAGAPSETESPQHGAWLRAVPGADDDVCLFTDGDIVLQRDFTDAEIAWLSSLPETSVAAGYNSGPGETARDEAARLFPKADWAEIGEAWDLSAPNYNIGVFAARRGTYAALHAAYLGRWGKVSEHLGHAARQQWLVCQCIARTRLKVQVTPYVFHANGHYGLPAGCGYVLGDVLTCDGQVVLFKHKL